MKTCPYCAEEIQDAAIKCRYCHEFLDESKRPVPPVAPPPLPGQTVPGTGLPWYFKTSFIVLTFVTVPPLALPSIWFHPRLHWAWKIAITAAILATCWLVFMTLKAFVRQFDEATRMLEEMRF